MYCTVRSGFLIWVSDNNEVDYIQSDTKHPTDPHIGAALAMSNLMGEFRHNTTPSFPQGFFTAGSAEEDEQN
jgi:hypothetical protein